VVKSAVVHDDGGLVTEIIEDTQYLSSVNLSCLSLVFRNLRKFLNLHNKILIVHTKCSLKVLSFTHSHVTPKPL